jgi:hypothetical protein
MVTEHQFVSDPAGLRRNSVQPLLVIPEFREAEYPGPRIKGEGPELLVLGTGSRAIALARHDIVSSSRVGEAGERLTPWHTMAIDPSSLLRRAIFF